MKKSETKEEFLDKLRNGNNIQSACQAVHVSRQTVYRWQNENEKFRLKVEEAQAEGDAFLNDYVENKAKKLIQNDDPKMIRFFLETRHPKYSNRHDSHEYVKQLEEEVEKFRKQGKIINNVIKTSDLSENQLSAMIEMRESLIKELKKRQEENKDSSGGNGTTTALI